MLPLFAGYAPILFRRRGFPDWLAHTLVLEAQQESLAEARMARVGPGPHDSPTTASPGLAANPGNATGNSRPRIDQSQYFLGGSGHEQAKTPEQRRSES